LQRDIIVFLYSFRSLDSSVPFYVYSVECRIILFPLFSPGNHVTDAI